MASAAPTNLTLPTFELALRRAARVLFEATADQFLIGW
jgi:hypothetical protein